MGWLTDDEKGEKFAEDFEEVVEVLVGAAIGFFVVIAGVVAWATYKTSVQTVLRAAQDIIFG